MLIFDQLKKGDRQLQWIAIGVLLGMAVLLAGLWYVQIISRKRYQTSLKIQSFRTVRLPAIRGKILDRNGLLLAQNQPRFNVNIYLEDLRPLFTHEYTNTVRSEYLRQTGKTKPARNEVFALKQQARYRVVSNIVAQVSSAVQVPLLLNENKFARHYTNELFLPLPIVKNLTPPQVALFMGKAADLPGIDLEIQPMRTYPLGATAVHLLGYLRREDRPVEEEEITYRYPLPDFIGATGLEAIFDQQLRGKAGVKSMLVDNIGYRQREEIWPAPEPGQNLFLTLDLPLQQAAERALRSAGAETRGAAIVMDARNGDILALASAPAYNPNLFITNMPPEEWQQLNDPTLKPQINRATYGAYAPGSAFKIVVGLACLEEGLHPEEVFHSKGFYRVGRGTWDDTAGPGEFDFRRAFYRSSNPYFIEHGLKVGSKKIIALGRCFHLGERTGLLPHQEVRGYFPDPGQMLKNDGSPWLDGDTANLSIGQGEITVTPLQMAVLTAAIANGGRIFWPRLVDRLEPQEADGSQEPTLFPVGRLRDTLPVQARHLQRIRDVMRADVEERDGTGHSARIPGLNICGKTGTAQVKQRRKVIDHITWFVSFAPYESPRYVVVVMVESGLSGGGTCAPLAQQIYRAIQKREQLEPAPPAPAVTLK